jgi:hypothetical protein
MRPILVLHHVGQAVVIYVKTVKAPDPDAFIEGAEQAQVARFARFSLDF